MKYLLISISGSVAFPCCSSVVKIFHPTLLLPGERPCLWHVPLKLIATYHTLWHPDTYVRFLKPAISTFVKPETPMMHRGRGRRANETDVKKASVNVVWTAEKLAVWDDCCGSWLSSGIIRLLALATKLVERIFHPLSSFPGRIYDIVTDTDLHEIVPNEGLETYDMETYAPPFVLLFNITVLFNDKECKLKLVVMDKA